LQEGHKALIERGNGPTLLPLIISERLPNDVVYIPAGFAETAQLTDPLDTLHIKRGDD